VVVLVKGKKAPVKRPSWRVWRPLSRGEEAVQRVMGGVAVRWAWTIRRRMGVWGGRRGRCEGLGL